jgi:hypothetical protein
MNTIIALFKTDHESSILSKGISAWSAFTCFVYSLFTRQKVETEAVSHAELGWKLSVLWPYLLARKDILFELNSTVPHFYIKTVFDPENQDEEYFLESDGYLFFSAASRMGGGTARPGTRFIIGENLLNHPERWKLLGKDQSPEECWESFMRCWNERNKGYDWWGISGFGVPVGALLKWLGRKIWYCSEIVYYALTKIIDRISPRRLGWWALQNGWKDLGDGSALAKK